jgi:hypothetical protein
VYDLFKSKYCELIDEFVTRLGFIDPTGLPAIHIPIIGKNYKDSATRIAFFGIDTYGWLSFRKFMEKYVGTSDEKGSAEKAYDYLTQSTKPSDYPGWTNNFHTSFWDYILQFLIKFYNFNSDFENNENYNEILESFIWGNTNSFEGYEKSAKEGGAEYSEWEKVKNASKIFDTAAYVLDICQPDILLIFNWWEAEEWLTGGKKIEYEDLEDHHLYYKFNNTNVYWLAHPRWIAPNFGIDESIKVVFDDLVKKEIILPDRSKLWRS